MRANVRAEDTAARLGGDEFAVLLDSPGDNGGRGRRGEPARRRCASRSRSATAKTVVATSIGIAPASSAATGDELLRNADVAMYAAKESGKHRFAHYEPEMHVQIRRRHEFEVELKLALDRDEIGVVFEPIVNLADGRIVAFEALARWFSPERGMVRPAEFIPVAEELGLMSQIGRRVLRLACQAARTWQTRYPSCAQAGVSVNLSPSELANASLADDVARALFETKLSPQSLMLEITESEMMRDLDVAHQRMDELRALGVQARARRLRHRPLVARAADELPARRAQDRQAVRRPAARADASPASSRPSCSSPARSTSAASPRASSSRSQVQQLLERGCTLGQGFHFTPPMTREELDRYLSISAIPLISPSLSSAVG